MKQSEKKVQNHQNSEQNTQNNGNTLSLLSLNSQNNSPNKKSSIVHDVEVKSRIAGTKNRKIEILPSENRLLIYKDEEDKTKGKLQQFSLNKIICTKPQTDKKGKQNFQIDTSTGKKYSIQCQNSHRICNDIQQGKQYHQKKTTGKVDKYLENKQPANISLKTINYMKPFETGLNMKFPRILSPTVQPFMNQIILKSLPPSQKQTNESDSKSQNQLNLKSSLRSKHFVNLEDWKLDTKKGGFLFINQNKKKNQTKILKFILKKFLSTGSFMGISFPTFAMKPESILQTYAKALGACPILMKGVKNPVERIKNFVCFLQSFSVLFADMEKPFNPPLGQTFQAKIADGDFYAQQISHHPPITAIYYISQQFTISGALQLTANIGANSATGLFVGDLKIQFKDKDWIIGRLLGGQFSGFVIGDTKFETYGSAYTYDNHKNVCSFSSTKNNNFEGFIGKLKNKKEIEFFEKVKSNERFKKFPFYDRNCFDTVYSSMSMVYNSHTSFDGKTYLNILQPSFFPFLPEQIPQNHLLLKSDSRLRQDIALRKSGKMINLKIKKKNYNNNNDFLENYVPNTTLLIINPADKNNKKFQSCQNDKLITLSAIFCLYIIKYNLTRRQCLLISNQIIIFLVRPS